MQDSHGGHATGNPLPYQRADMQTPYRPMLHVLPGLYTKDIVTRLHTQILTSQPSVMGTQLTSKLLFNTKQCISFTANCQNTHQCIKAN